MLRSRRSLLGTLAGLAGLSTTTAGCLSFGGGQDYRFLASDLDTPLGREFLVANPASRRAETRLDYTAERKQAFVDELFETGTVTAVQWPLTELTYWGDHARPRPAFVLRDGVYYHIHVEEEQVDRDRWLFAVERTDDEPAGDATVLREPFSSLSERDAAIVQAALDAIYAGNDGFLGEPEFDELQPVEYHEGMDPDASELVPSPPFEYVEYAEDYYRPVTDRRTVSVPKRTFSLEQVADSAEAFERYANETIPDVRFSDVSVSDAEREVLDAVVDPENYSGHNEDHPLSDGLASALAHLGIRAHLRPASEYSGRVEFRNAIAEYEGDWYRFDLLVNPKDVN
ncbi:hypothetical protein [Haloarchaeobius sp. HME9146]|uniref:hypothetical protein n=1 Tax=Haloarchaeobius sp. HME9146 TaxID=2978732 RepID=UPI0021C20BF6|nr:hypothetical protein [Haloarchaeobius sp. HME9146]MCT9095196.1 hypothetical protein [Haloarchaeobius sp. HME9146]